MSAGQKTSSEIFADFTLSRVPHAVRDSLTNKQYDAIRCALIAQDKCSRHSIDLRIRIPLFFRSYYAVLFAGRDRRASTYRLEYIRLTRVPKPLRRAFYLLASFSLAATVFTVLFTVAYKVKSIMGIDIFPDFHLQDLLSFENHLQDSDRG